MWILQSSNKSQGCRKKRSTASEQRTERAQCDEIILHKGFDILLKAFAFFSKSNADWSFEIVGEGEEENLYWQIISTEKLEQRVQICPFTSDIQRHYSAASFFILSSRWEGQPLVLIEAMAHWLPIFSSDIPVARELLSGNGASVMFSNGDVIDMAETMKRMASTEEWTKLSQKAVAFSRDFCVDETCAKWNSVFMGKWFGDNHFFL